jgi:hypothetical protein
MTTDEAIEICNAWFAHNERQRAKTKRLAELATLARTGPEGHAKAKRELAQIDRTPTVYDGGRLEPAVKQILKHLRRSRQ